MATLKRGRSLSVSLTKLLEAILALARLRTSHFAGAGSCRPSPLNRMSPLHAGHSSGNSSPALAMSLAQAIREVSCERGFCFALQQPSEP